MFDHPLSHHVAEKGVSHKILQTEILAENLVTKPWPRGFDPSGVSMPSLRGVIGYGMVNRSTLAARI